jgi:hypothetical protein
MLTISWPKTFGGWVLDTTPTLAGSPPPWAQVPVAQYLTNATSIYFNSNPPLSSPFFRLRKL